MENKLIFLNQKKGDKGYYLCECGKKCWKNIYKVTTNHTRSCGCLKKTMISNANKKHGMTKSPEYRAWTNMKTRCYNSKYVLFHHYGARGIIVCPEWLNSFENFLNDVGKKPNSKSYLDRIDNNGNYEPKNVKWSTVIESARNKSNVKKISIYGHSFFIPEWSLISGIPRVLIWRRLEWGWSSIDAVFQKNSKSTISYKKRKRINKEYVIKKIGEYLIKNAAS